jgi:SAM-dependent methyltransferase
MFFQKFSEFVDLDNRQNRVHTPLTYETLTNKHEKMAPQSLVKGKRILDLGSCLGATGHWCLTLECDHYTGIELQDYYVEKSSELLKKYWSEDKFIIVKDEILNFLKNNRDQYDIVFACGIIYGFLNTYGFLELVANSARDCVIVDCSYPTQMTHARATVIDIVNIQHMIKSEDHRSYLGLGARPSPAALHRLMSNLGFENKENLLFPKKLTDSSVHDTYHDLIKREYGIDTPARYLIRFYRTEQKIKSAIENLIDNTRVVDLPITPELIKETKPWKFDAEVAERFQKEAETHIPDYQKVIDLSIDLLEDHFNSKEIKVIDVGSALGHTIECLLDRGFHNVKGVDKSRDMISKSKFSDRIVNLDQLPREKFHAVIINWTLHFIENKESYLKDVYDSLPENGVLILTDKMIQTEIVKKQYYDWKISNGVTQKQILEKEKKLIGAMFLENLDWYLSNIKSIGFRSVDLVNSRFNFNTLYCVK